MIPPENRGQVVTHAYVQCGRILLRSSYDASDKTQEYFAVKLTPREYDAVDPTRREPRVRGKWTRISLDDVEDILSGDC